MVKDIEDMSLESVNAEINKNSRKREAYQNRLVVIEKGIELFKYLFNYRLNSEIKYN
jgi:hypothetical protein